jgi:quercetin dioxygenase-like cupin family protein
MATTAKEIRLGQLRIRFLLEGAETGGTVSAFEFAVPAGAKVPAAHRHDGYDETVYGVEGVLTWTLDGEPCELRAGEALHVPRGAVHRFENLGDSEAKAFAAVTPGVLRSDYFRELAAALAGGGPPDPEAIGAVMRRHGLTPA